MVVELLYDWSNPGCFVVEQRFHWYWSKSNSSFAKEWLIKDAISKFQASVTMTSANGYLHVAEV